MSALYRVVIAGRVQDLPEEAVLDWVLGVADCHGEREALDAVKRTDPQDTQRIHSLQLAHSRGWLEYRYIIRPGEQEPPR